MFKYITALFFLLALSNVFADEIALGEPGYGGTGCPQGTVSATLSPDKTTLSVLFDEYLVEAGVDKRIDRKSCNLAIPVHVPQGFSVSIFKVDYRGFAAIPPGGKGRFDVEYFFAGGQGPVVTENFPSPFENDYLFTDRLQAKAVIWSRCGEDVNLRINSSIMARTNKYRDDTLITVDSVDIDSGMIYHVKWRRCN